MTHRVVFGIQNEGFGIDYFTLIYFDQSLRVLFSDSWRCPSSLSRSAHMAMKGLCQQVFHPWFGLRPEEST